MRSLKTRRVIGLALFLISTVFVLWGFWPVTMKRQTLHLSPDDLQPPPSFTDRGSYAAPEPRVLELEWPVKLRVGDTASIRMNLIPEEVIGSDLTVDKGQEKIAGRDGQELIISGAEPILAQSKLDLPGMEYKPAGTISDAVVPGKPVRFLWSVRSAQSDHFSGTLWLYFNYDPQSGMPELRKVISAQIFNIQASKLLGLSGNAARIVGCIGLVVAATIIFDLFSRNFTNRPHAEPGRVDEPS